MAEYPLFLFFFFWLAGQMSILFFFIYISGDRWWRVIFLGKRSGFFSLVEGSVSAMGVMKNMWVEGRVVSTCTGRRRSSVGTMNEK